MPPAHQHQAAGAGPTVKPAVKPRYELADVFRAYGEHYRKTHRLSRSHLKVMRAIESCRTASLGGHIEQCDFCGFQQQAYDSCRNRHCPKCGSLAKARWLDDRKAELLPVGYFHLVFTVPHELNPLALSNKKVVCGILFKAVSRTLLEFARTHLGGLLGFTCVLHTWDQTLLDHFHLHCLIPGGALSLDLTRWNPARENFLFSVEALGLVFRGKFLDSLQRAFTKNQLQFPGRSAELADPPAFSVLLATLRGKGWVVYAKRPFSSPETVLDYLGRYTQRVALSNNRILSVEDGRVAFSYLDRKHNNKGRTTDKPRRQTMILEADEFIRRFLLHVLPDRFMRVRHFGFLANRSKKENLARCRQLMGVEPDTEQRPARSARDLMLEVSGVDISLCPVCKTGRLVVISRILPELGETLHTDAAQPAGLDSS